MLRAVAGWLGRTGFLYLLLCAAVAFYVFAWPGLKSEFSGDTLRQDVMLPEQLQQELGRDREQVRGALDGQLDTWRDAGPEVIETRRQAVQTELREIDAALDERDGWFDSIRPSQVLATKRLELRKAALEAERDVLDQADNLAQARNRKAKFKRWPTQQSIDDATRTCALWTRRLDDFDARNLVEREYRERVRGDRTRIAQAKARECGKRARWTRERNLALAANKALQQARDAYDSSAKAALSAFAEPVDDIPNNALREVALKALLILVGILIAPLVLRALFYFVLAPFVEKGRPLRLVEATAATGPPRLEDGPAPSISVALKQDQELLVRQAFLQTRPATGNYATRWLLDWGKPFTSLASGMAFLTQARGSEAGFGISARADPFAEIATLALAPGSALVMQPRALAGLVQHPSRPIRITRKWRFGLHAWLTFQFRYLIFHGPGTLIVKGGRGVRVEPAAEGRMFAQDQLIGFSAHTRYSAARSETFAPYLFGRAPLFRDRVTDMDIPGVLVIEEAPMAGKRKGIARGLEKGVDAALKAFGI